MAMNPFPPQAYTRETLVKAYQWLQNQHPNIKELASTPDLLCSLYLKAQMQGNEALDRPSLHNFKSELKSLAGMMGEFETSPAAEALTEQALSQMTMPTPAQQSSAPSANASLTPPTRQAMPLSTPPAATPAPAAPRAGGPQVPPPSPAPRAQTSAPSHHETSAKKHDSHGFTLDSRSQHMIQEVKTIFNLGSENEALHLLISVGYTKMKRFIENP